MNYYIYNNIIDRLVIGADGNNSIIRRLSNITTYGWSYGQEAIITIVKLQSNDLNDLENNTAFQKYLSTGPIAMLPLWNGYSSIVWSVPFNKSQKLLKLSKEEFIIELNNAFQTESNINRWNNQSNSFNSSLKQSYFNEKINNFNNLLMKTSELIDERINVPIINDICSNDGTYKLLNFPLSFQHVNSYVSNRIALIGDSAHSFHPQAGQGLNLGLKDSKALSECISLNQQNGMDIGDINGLNNYNNKQYYSNLSMMSSVDIINTIFSETIKEPLKFNQLNNQIMNESMKYDSITTMKHYLRSFGMLGIHSLPFIKRKIAEFAIG